MTVTLRPLTRDNLWAVVDLKLHPGQEAFVADNIDSIANASVEPTWSRSRSTPARSWSAL